MGCFSDDAKKLFQKWEHSELCDDIEDTYSELLKRRVDTVEYGDPDTLNSKPRTRLNCQVLRQALVHRAERLLASAGTMLLEKNVYGLALIARGHLEGTAVLGNFCNRLGSLTKGNIAFEKFEWEMADAVLGAKHDLFAKANAPVSILTSIERADKFLDGNVFPEKKKMLQDIYGWLSEFAHPNYLSNSSAFVLDKATKSVVFRHENEVKNNRRHLPTPHRLALGLPPRAPPSPTLKCRTRINPSSDGRGEVRMPRGSRTPGQGKRVSRLT
jgi:hypothetical protein